MILRVIFSIFLILSAFLLPWWLVALISIAGLLYFKNLYEVVLVGLIMDSLYGTSIILDFPYTLTLIALILVAIMNSIRNRLIMY